METIFHFNCVICGAYPQEKNFDKFAWPSSPQQVVDLLSCIKWILPNVEKTTWASEPFRQIIRNLTDTLSGKTSPPLHRFEGKETIFTCQCPLCDTPPGARPYDRYFRAWFAWNLLCRVQVGNLLYELSMLFNRSSETKYLIPYFKKAIDHLELGICHCGRPTTTLYHDGYCRWCLDSGANVNDKKDEEGSFSFGITFSVIPKEPLPDEFTKWLYSIREDNIFGIKKEQWNGLLEAMAQDVREQADGGLRHLQVAVLAYQVDSVLDKIRQELSRENRWPGEWNGDSLAAPTSLLDKHENASFTYLDLPREAVEILDDCRVTEIPEEIAVILEQRGLLEYGKPSDVRVYLNRMRLNQVREISNKLGAGKARSKSDLIDKILATASHEQIELILPGLKEKWIKEVKKPLFDPGEGWTAYARLVSLLLRNFLRAKFNSARLQRLAQKYREHLLVQVDSECPSLCKIHAMNFTAKEAISLNDLPPWFPGCGCLLARQMQTWIYGEKQPLIGSKVWFEENNYWLRVQPYDLMSLMNQSVKSPNRKYHLLWQDGSGDEKEFEPGWYMLIEDSVINAVGRLDRPNDGKVANNGTFIISDWMSHREFGGTIWVFNNQGKLIYCHSCTANIGSIAISDSGKYAVCSFLGGNTTDAETIQVIDLVSGQRISQFSPEVYNYLCIEIDDTAQVICLTDDNKTVIKFTFAGALIN